GRRAGAGGARRADHGAVAGGGGRRRRLAVGTGAVRPGAAGLDEAPGADEPGDPLARVARAEPALPCLARAPAALVGAPLALLELGEQLAPGRRRRLSHGAGGRG